MTVLLDWDGLKARGINLSQAQIYRNMSKGTFPRPVKISACKNAWVAAEVDQWVADRMKQRDQAPA